MDFSYSPDLVDLKARAADLYKFIRAYEDTCEESNGLTDADHALALAALDDEFRIKRDQRRRGVRLRDRDAAVGVEQRMLAVHALGRVGEAGGAAGAVARQAGPVIPAARVLGGVAADGAGIADLR